MADQQGFVVLSFLIILTCASVYAVGYYVCNAEPMDEGAPTDEIMEIKQRSLLEPEDKCLFA